MTNNLNIVLFLLIIALMLIIYNLFQHIVMSSARVMSANWLATNGQDWSKLLARRDGPENISRPIQWVVVRAVDSSVWLVEQHPQMTHAIDYTKTLSERENLLLDGHSIFEKKDKDSQLKLKINEIELTKRTMKKLQNLQNIKREIGRDSHEEMKKKKFYESFEKKLINDPPGLKKFTEFRGDFAETPIPFGVIDSKVTFVNVNGLKSFEATCGPSRSNDEEIFVWSETFPHTPHTGQPDKFDFPNVTPQWVWF